jgi:hypothetical protein
MYEAVLAAFFDDFDIQALVSSGALTQTVMHIRPPPPDALPQALSQRVTRLIEERIGKRGFTRVPEEQPGGFVISYGELKADPRAYASSGQTGPTIFMSIVIVGQECGTFSGRGYVLLQEDQRWRAEPYLQAMC